MKQTNTNAKKSTIKISKSGKTYNSVYGTKEWQENRAEYLKTHPKCEWCGSTEYLSIHHRHEYKYEIQSEITSIEDQIVNQLIRREVDAGKIPPFNKYPDKMEYVCKCGYLNLIANHAKTNTCKGCGTKNVLKEFPLEKLYNYRLTREGSQEFLKKYHSEIQENLKIKLKEEKISAEPSYLDFNERSVIVICKRCHYAAEHGMDKCPTCSGYKIERYPICKKCKDKENQQSNEQYNELAAELGFDPEDSIPLGDIMRDIIPTADEVILTKLYKEFGENIQW